MNEKQVSASGERGALTGYMAQFGQFAQFVYRALVDKQLEWLRLADPDAGKLDDIFYATLTEIHAYQVKWTGAGANISFAGFKALLPGFYSSWQQLRNKYGSTGKNIFGHLLTNKRFSVDDRITTGNQVLLGTFTDFYQQVWLPLHKEQPVATLWSPIVEELAVLCGVTEVELQDFIQHFELHPAHEPQEFSVTQTDTSRIDAELSVLRAFLMQEVGSPERRVEFTAGDLLQKLNWSRRFQPIFNHELVVDARRYQPNRRTLTALDTQLREHTGGYLFLEGSPGSGKSTLLTHWLKGRPERIIRYYAFDFRNPSSLLNTSERGDAASLYFDLVVQLRQGDVYPEKLSPHRGDLPFLLDVFERQLAALAEEFHSKGRATILLIDGLDHVPREYRGAALSFLRELPAPDRLPAGVYIVLGSQTYELADLKPAVRDEWRAGSRTVQISPLSWPETHDYIAACQIQPVPTASQQQHLFDKSQGHPLYLAYLCGRVEQGEAIEQVLATAIQINGNIETYYDALWQPVSRDRELVELLGLVARVNGSVSLKFMGEWPFPAEVGRHFREKAKLLFSELSGGLSFFHNSFRQFLLQQTALNHFTNTFDEKADKDFHRRLADYYQESGSEPQWKANYHLYRAGELDRFVAATTIEKLGEQLVEFRPAAAIEQDAKLGIQVACQTGNVVLLSRYLFALTEVKQRDENLPLFTEELLTLGKPGLARDALRDGKTLLVSKASALHAAKVFYRHGDDAEAAILVELAEPEAIRSIGIHLDGEEDYRTQESELIAWAEVARYHQPLSAILDRLDNITLDNPPQHWLPHESPAQLRLDMLDALADNARQDRKWGQFDTILARYGQSTFEEDANTHHELVNAVITCLNHNEQADAVRYLDSLLAGLDQETMDGETRIAIADLIYRVHRDLPLVEQWLADVAQPVRTRRDWDDIHSSLSLFKPLITYNKLLRYLGRPVAVTDAVPIVAAGPRELPVLELQRMLCRMAQLAGEARDGELSLPSLRGRIRPIVQFYYQSFRRNSGFAFRASLVKGDYYELLVQSIAQAGSAALAELHTFFRAEFVEQAEYWEPKVQRKILLALYQYGMKAGLLTEDLRHLDPDLLTGLDMEQRVSESMAQARAWLQFGKPASAEQWLQQAIREAFSVGYRKDYQFSEWLGWLARINAEQPEQAQERISWFLARLHHLQDITEGRAYWRAAEQLLGITFDWNFSAGLRQLCWQLERGRITFNDALETFISAYLRRAQTTAAYLRIVPLYTDLLLVLATEASVALLEQLLNTGLTLLGDDFYQQLPALVTAIRRRALQNTRATLLTSLEKFIIAQSRQVSQYVPDFAIPPGQVEQRSQDNKLKLRGDGNLSEAEVLVQATGYDELLELLEQEVEDSYFNWEQVLSRLNFQLSAEQLQRLAQCPTRRREAHFLAALSRIALRSGELNLARQLAERSVVESKPGGWTSFYDGGSRLASFTALREVAPVEAMAKAFATFEHDALDGDWLSYYVRNIDDILPALTDDIPLLQVWEEVFGYVQRLLLTSRPEQDLPDLIPRNQPIEEVLAELLGYLAQYPLISIQERVRGLMAEAIVEGDSFCLNWLTSQPEHEVAVAELLLEVLMRLPATMRAQLSGQEMRPQLERLAKDSDYGQRTQAQQLLIEASLPLPAVASRPLPAIYSLSLPTISPQPILVTGIDRFTVPTPGSLEKQLSPFDWWVDQLAEVTNLKRSALLHRAAALMREVAAPTTWAEAANAESRQWLESIQLMYPFLPPRVKVARRAILCLAAELVDAGEVEAADLEPLFTMRDYPCYSFPEVDKPAFIQSIEGHEYTPSPTGWLGALEQHTRLGEQLLVYDTDRFVIGEATRLRGLTWEQGTECYQMQVTVDPADPDGFFNLVFHQPTDQYPSLTPEGRCFVVQRQHHFSQADYRTTWLAFNPLVARHLGWKPALQGLFAWQHQGQLMVESVCWSEGNINMPAHQPDSVAGEGWLVLASAEALRQLDTLNLSMIIHRKIVRSETRDQQDHERTISERVPYNEHVSDKKARGSGHGAAEPDDF